MSIKIADISDPGNKEIFEIDNEKLKKIKEMAIGELTPQGLLGIFPLFAGSRNKNGKKRIFVYDEEWGKEKNETVEGYNKLVLEHNKMDDEVEGIMKIKNECEIKRDEIIEKMVALEGRVRELRIQMQDNSAKRMEVLSKFIELTGSDNVELWR